MNPRYRLDRYLSLDGTSSSSKDATGDYSSAAEEFYIQPRTDRIFYIERMVVLVQDNANFTAAGYGGLAALTNGIQVKVLEGATELADLTDGLPIKSLVHWARCCYDLNEFSFGSGDNFVAVRWTFSKDSARPIKLVEGQRLAVILNDDMSGLTGHTFMVKGWLEVERGVYDDVIDKTDSKG